jgi:crossover junction endodeoxyribonuclease RuvC
VTGYGVVTREDSHIRFITCGAIRNAAARSMPLRLKTIYAGLRDVIREHAPDEFAIETAFYGRNAQSALKLGHARGVSILAAVEHEIPTAEYSPREVKKAVVGNGAASKEQVRFMVTSLLHIPGSRLVLDASDALAVALCHLHRLDRPSVRYRDWKSFVEANPERVRG